MVFQNVTEFKSPTMLMELQTNIVDGKECAADIADLAKKLKRPVHHVNPELEICAFHSAKSGVCYVITFKLYFLSNLLYKY